MPHSRCTRHYVAIDCAWVGTLLVSSVEGDIGVEILSDVLNNFLEAKVRRSLREGEGECEGECLRQRVKQCYVPSDARHAARRRP